MLEKFIIELEFIHGNIKQTAAFIGCLWQTKQFFPVTLCISIYMPFLLAWHIHWATEKVPPSHKETLPLTPPSHKTH